MKRGKILSILFTLFFLFIQSQAFSQTTKFHSLSQEIDYLMNLHRSHSLFLKKASNSFEQGFFSDISFIKGANARHFFHQIEASLKNGQIPHGNTAGSYMVSYTSFSSINGKTTGVNYQYSVRNGKVVLTKGTVQNGNRLKAVYEYDRKGKLLNVNEFRNGDLLQQKTHLLNI